jgi:AsmA-like protein
VSDGVLDLSAERPTYRGSVHAGPGALGAIAIDRVKGDVRATPPVVDVDALECETLGGTITGSAHLSGEQGLTAKIAARGIQLAKAPAPRNRPRPDGTLGLEGAVAGPTGAAFAAQATGQGRFDVADGRIEGAGFGKPILDALQPFIRPGVADRLRERYPDVFADDDLRFTRLSGSGRLAGGRIRSDDLVLAAKSWEARGEGSLGLDGDVDARIQLLASPALTADVLGQSRTRAALVDASGRLSIPLRARGPVRRPEVTPDPAFAATAARALIGKEAGEAAGQLLERLFGERKRGTGR